MKGDVDHATLCPLVSGCANRVLYILFAQWLCKKKWVGRAKQVCCSEQKIHWDRWKKNTYLALFLCGSNDLTSLSNLTGTSRGGVVQAQVDNLVQSEFVRECRPIKNRSA